MLKIRTEQLEAFRVALTERADLEMTATLRERFPEIAARDLADVRELVRAGRVRGRRLGIYERADVERFLRYLVRHGSSFGESETTAWASEILTDDNRTGSEKLAALDARMIERGEGAP